MLELTNLAYIIEKIKELLTQPIVTIIMLLVILFRIQISKLFVKLGYKLLNLKEKSTKNSKTVTQISIFITISCLGFILCLWVKNIKIMAMTIKIIKLVGIFTIARILKSIICSNDKFLDFLVDKNLISDNILINTFLKKITSIVIYVIAIFMCITELGYNVNGLATGLGVSSAVMALAIQDVVKNIIAGAIIISEKPFSIGDSVEIKKGAVAYGGVVEEITLRNTKIRMLDNSIMSVPNSTMSNESVINYTEIDNRRVDIKLLLPIDIPTSKLNRIISKIRIVVESNPKVLTKTVVVALEKITEFSNQIYIYCYISESKYVNYLKVNEQINFDILKVLEVEDIEISKPKQTLLIEKQERKNNKTQENKKIEKNKKENIIPELKNKTSTKDNDNIKYINIRND